MQRPPASAAGASAGGRGATLGGSGSPSYRDAHPARNDKLRPVPLPRRAVRRMWREAYGVLIATGDDVLRAMAVASVACVSRVSDDDADFLRAIAAGTRLTPATAPRFHTLAGQIRRGGSA